MGNTISTKSIARETGRTVSEINEIARDLGITRYSSELRSWRIEAADARLLTEHLADHA